MARPSAAARPTLPILHGPYIQWTRTVDGKTVSRYLTTEQLEAYMPWFDNAKRLRELLSELEAISVREVESAIKRRDKS